MNFPEHLLYTKEHVWVELCGNQARVGISDFAQSQLNDIVFIDLPQPGAQVWRGEQFSVVESVKSVSDIYSPMDGIVLEINGKLAEKPELINEDPYGAGWIVIIETPNPVSAEGLLSVQEYAALLSE